MSDFVPYGNESASKGEIKFTLQQGIKAQRRSGGIALMQPQCYVGVGGKCYALATLPLGNRPSTHSTAGWAGPRAILTGGEIKSQSPKNSFSCLHISDHAYSSECILVWKMQTDNQPHTNTQPQINCIFFQHCI